MCADANAHARAQRRKVSSSHSTPVYITTSCGLTSVIGFTVHVLLLMPSCAMDLRREQKYSLKVGEQQEADLERIQATKKSIGQPRNRVVWRASPFTRGSARLGIEGLFFYLKLFIHFYLCI